VNAIIKANIHSYLIKFNLRFFTVA